MNSFFSAEIRVKSSFKCFHKFTRTSSIPVKKGSGTRQRVKKKVATWLRYVDSVAAER
jgi:hypothetical protein